MPRASSRKLPLNLVGASGVYFVAAELLRRRCLATITPGNAQGADILASNGQGTRSVCIQVKTTRKRKKEWMVNSHKSEQLFYVLVHLHGDSQLPDYYIVPSKVVARQALRNYREYLRRERKDGKPRKGNSIRKYKNPHIRYRDWWEQLGLS